VLAFFLARKVFSHATGLSLVDFGPTGWPELIASICLLLFYLALGWFILVRPSPAGRTDGVLPSLIAFAGTYLPWTIVLLAPGEASTGRSLVSAALLLVAPISGEHLV
jgi:ABC-type spermidine/putrescine transport system permease subunit II